jgi:hypothetical protein
MLRDQQARKLDIVAPYLRRMRDQRPALCDLNVNGWLERQPRRPPRRPRRRPPSLRERYVRRGSGAA